MDGVISCRYGSGSGPPLGRFERWAWALCGGSCFANHPNHSYPLVLTVRWEVWTRVLILFIKVSVWEWVRFPLFSLFVSLLIMVVYTINNVKSVLTQIDLDLFCATYNISADLGPELPGVKDTIKDSPEGKIGIYTRLIEFANFPMKVSHFEIMCRVLGHQPSLGLERSLFWIDASVCPIFVPWNNDVSVKKDPLPSYDIVDFGLLEKLDYNHTLIRKYPKTFLCLVGLSRSFSDPTSSPTLLYRDKSETTDMVVNPSPQTICLVTYTITDEINVHSGKNKSKVGASVVPPPVKKARTAADSRAKEFVSSSVTPTLKRDSEDESVSNYDDNDVSLVPSVPENADIVATELAGETHGSSVLMTEVGGSSIPKNETGTSSVAPKRGSHDVTNSARMDDPIMCRNLVDHVPPQGYWASLRNLNDADFLDRVNLNYAQHVCMVFELLLRYEHKITVREKFEKKFTGSSEVIEQKEAKIVKLNSKLEKANGEAADVVEVRKKVFELEVRDSLEERILELEAGCGLMGGQVKGEAKLKEQFMVVQDDLVLCLADRSSALDACIFELSYHVDSKLYPHMLTANVGRRWVIGHSLRLDFMKCRESVEYQTALGKIVSLTIYQGIRQGLKARINHGKAALTRCRKVILGEALEASRAHAQEHKWAASLSFVVVFQDQWTFISYVAVVTPLNSITVEDYIISDVSILRTVMESGP
uniref:Transposase (Putative), gypsy type n=1 Tax=Tanacetum cinerariifolium TaxID=118510 RepID=A0A6L2MBI4_TANCI|nr:hypothetical protein [Tanacetum cinerariifolium]